MLNLRTSPKSVKILLLMYIKLFLSMILLFLKVVVFARIKAKISGESLSKSKCYKFPWNPGSIPAEPVMKKYNIKQLYLNFAYEIKTYLSRRSVLAR